MLKIRGLVTLLVVVAAFAVGTGVAGAHVFRADSEVTIRYNDAKDQFQGRVLSDRQSCVKRRQVVVEKKLPNGNTLTVGADKTNDVGFWKVEEKKPVGRYYARVLRRVRGSGDHRHVCRADRSETIKIEHEAQPGA